MLGLVVACAALATPASVATASPADDLRVAVENVSGATAHRYDARDDRGERLDCLKVIQSGGRYLGVHHSDVGGRLTVSVVKSSDLLHWAHAATLDTDAAQPTIAAMPGGGYVVVYEKGRGALLPVPTEVDRLLAPLPPVQRLGRAVVQLRFRYYPTTARLLAGRASLEFTAPLSLSPTAEGTPSVSAVTSSGGVLGSRISVGMHYFSDLNGDSYPDVDRQARGVLTRFLHWNAADAPDLNDAFAGLQTFHAGFTSPPAGNLGDRDHVTVDGTRLDVHEAQYRPGDFSSWRPFLIDPAVSQPLPLQVHTDGASQAFGNPTATALRLPSGKAALFMSLFVFSEMAAPGESGSLVYYSERAG